MTKKQLSVGSISLKRFSVLTLLFFFSGVTGMLLQVVWMYKLGLLFGNASYATAATLVAFFLGLSLGGWFLGNASAKFKKPLLAYGFIEIGIAATALLLIPGFEFYETNYATVVNFVDGSKTTLTFIKFIFSISLLLLPSILMGGTFPVLAQYIGKNRNTLASKGTILYAVNTIGAALGAFLSGFYLLSNYGVIATYNFATILAAFIGVMAIILEKFNAKKKKNNIKQKKQTSPNSNIANKILLNEVNKFNISYNQFILLAFSSGLLALSAETLWTRMFAQVLQNSVYSFSAILVVFLLALGFGGIISHLAVKFKFKPANVLITLLTLATILLGFSPEIFNYFTQGLNYLAPGESWASYILAVFKLSFSVVFFPTVIFGAIFPYLLKAAPVKKEASGKFVGKLVLFNSIGSTIGPAISGFILLDTIGLWNSIKFVSIFYGIIAIHLALTSFNKGKIKWAITPIIIILSIITVSNPSIVKLRPGEKITEMWQSSDGVVSIVQSSKNIEMRLDNYYVLGDSGSILVEQMQGHIPLLIHPNPKNVLFLGMGTGITSGASLTHGVEHVVVVELISNVITASKRYFSKWTNNLFNDSRVEIISDDARNYLLGSSEQFDVIVGDLFTPWHAGTGSLYTVEHFIQAKNHLKKEGIFAQWLPLYQLTPDSFEIIAATFASVFPEVTVWRADFSGKRASIVLLGQEAGSKLNQNILKKNIGNVVGNDKNRLLEDSNHMAGLFYIGNLKAIQNKLSSVLINNDNLRTIEFNAPILTQRANAGKDSYIVKNELEKLLSTFAENLPPKKDPYLHDLPPEEIKYVTIGLLYYRYLMLVADKKDVEALLILKKINTLAPDFLNTSLK
ncbi:fused MFS/spermidine synthase [Lutibacter sp.]